MTKRFLIITLCGSIIALTGLQSCSSDGVDEVLVSVAEKVDCSGDLKSYIQLSKGNYTLKKQKSYESLGGEKLAHLQLSISFDGIKAAEVSGLQLILSIVDENYNQVNSKAVFKIDAWSSEAQNTIISGIKSGEGKFSVSISTESGGVGQPVDADEWKEIKEKAKYIVLSSSKAESIRSTGSIEKSNDIDELLDEFDSVHKTANTMEQLELRASEKAHILDELERLTDELEGLESDMSSNQRRKYEYIKNRTYDDYSDEDIEADNIQSQNRSNNNGGASNWDDLLNSYEKYVDRYIAYLKKAQNGDMSAMSEYTKLLEEANNYLAKLEKAKGDLTPSQLNRLNQINIKKLEALQKMK